MKNYRYGLYMGGFALVPIVLSQAVFPISRSDDGLGPLILAVYLCTFLYYGAAGFLASRVIHRVEDGVWTGATTALIGMGLIMVTFALVDNIFLETVSRQVDKIRAFEQSNYSSMRAYINWSLLQGVIFALPVLGVIGAAFGGVGGLLAERLTKAAAAR